MEKLFHKGDEFEVVESVPAGYVIWNIGSNMLDGYLPLCRLKTLQEFSGGRAIETDTLKAVPMKEAQVVLDAVGFGPGTEKEMERYLERYKDARKGTLIYRRCRKIEKALEVLKRYKVWG